MASQTLWGPIQLTQVHSIGAVAEVVRMRQRFQNDSRVHMHLGDSAVVLGNCKRRPAGGWSPCFYLDAHWSGGRPRAARGQRVSGHAQAGGAREAPEEELADVIVVDDLRPWAGQLVRRLRGDLPAHALRLPARGSREDANCSRTSARSQCAKPDRLIFF